MFHSTLYLYAKRLRKHSSNLFKNSLIIVDTKFILLDRFKTDYSACSSYDFDHSLEELYFYFTWIISSDQRRTSSEIFDIYC